MIKDNKKDYNVNSIILDTNNNNMDINRDILHILSINIISLDV